MSFVRAGESITTIVLTYARTANPTEISRKRIRGILVHGSTLHKVFVRQVLIHHTRGTAAPKLKGHLLRWPSHSTCSKLEILFQNHRDNLPLAVQFSERNVIYPMRRFEFCRS